MKRFRPLLPALLLAMVPLAQAEKADAFQPTEISCRACEADGVTGIMTVKGGVVITRGTLRIEADSGRVERSPDGYQRAWLAAGAGGKVRFRQKADGPGERWIEGEADRVEYDERAATVKLFSGATIRRTANDRLPEEARGEYIAYDSRKEFYVMRNTPSGEDRPGAGRNTIILPPSRIAPPAGALAGKAAQ
ncbi:lipopolysaccharide transport periplasmic protein LptA [Massilia agri]|uniref:Lipopolysaccharide export system protein LptA n=1 Tax=Massilia agri TaxID=1886785 RepID=A0ABT2AN46_9BURK|nr:lipopolysaccharide transport periplasmic protein LptA [Massilia agri]MCS0597605.1 lipopolysaccharide transport periplasmic protein LptA [Massilia agri]